MATDRVVLEALRAGPARFRFAATSRNGAHRLVGRWGKARPAQLHEMALRGLVAEEDVLDGGERVLTYRITAHGLATIGARAAPKPLQNRRSPRTCSCGCGRPLDTLDDEWSVDVGGGLRIDCAEEQEKGTGYAGRRAMHRAAGPARDRVVRKRTGPSLWRT
jgi:hypothetical protein